MAMLGLRDWLFAETEKFKADFMASEYPGPFAWLYYLNLALSLDGRR